MLFIQHIGTEQSLCANHYAGSWGIANSESRILPASKEYTFEGGDFKNNYEANYLLSFSVSVTKEKPRMLWMIESGLNLLWMSEVSLRMELLAVRSGGCERVDQAKDGEKQLQTVGIAWEDPLRQERT